MDITPVVVKDRLCRGELDGAGEVGDGLLVVLQRGVGITSVVVKDRLCRGELDGATIVGNSLLALP